MKKGSGGVKNHSIDTRNDSDGHSSNGIATIDHDNIDNRQKTSSSNNKQDAHSNDQHVLNYCYSY